MTGHTIPCDNPEVLSWWRESGHPVEVRRLDGHWAQVRWEPSLGDDCSLAFFRRWVGGAEYRLVLPSSPVECAEPVVLEWWANNVEGGEVQVKVYEGAVWISTNCEDAEDFAGGLTGEYHHRYRLIAPPSSVESEPVPVEPEGADFPRFVQGAIRRFVRAGRGEPWVEVDAEGAPVEPEAPKGLPDDAVEVPWFLPAHRAWVVPPASPDPGTGWEYMTTGPRTEWFPWAEATCGGYRVIRFVPAPAATEDVPLHEVIGRTLYIDSPSTVREVRTTSGGSIWSPTRNGPWAPLDVNDDGTVTVLSIPSDRGEGA